ncbi:MFS transporter [Pararhodobacter oceanensis]|uniref:MFS transporter n=1 Tax=Pararhodobacter oceanensis TaxID=2172121 RepID=A0A2T8HV39_9RHOB|nr:MFS transporter [Pararhodobacter oceanensis]PVH29300.1 MFS transporter [Pararhodobacter oceanensis]
MKLGIFFLVIAYVLSQFYRAFLAVLSPVLGTEIGAMPNDLALSSGLWFLTFAAMQIPIGWALDTLGPRRTAAWILGVAGGGGAAVFALAQAPIHLHIAMALIGIGCSPVLMASYYIFGRIYSARAFATLAGAVIGFGTLGNLAGAWPLAFAAETFGWRQTVGALALVTLLVALAVAVFVKDPPQVEDSGAGKGSLLDIFKIRALWLIFPLMAVSYLPAAGMRGLWAGPYFADVYGADAITIGWVTLAMALAMVAGAFVYGPLDRLFGTRKWVVLTGNALGMLCMFALWWLPTAGYGFAVLMLVGVGLFGSSYPLMMAHGRSFFPPHLLGRGVTMMNLFSIGGVGVLQTLSARVHGSVAPQPPEAPYQAIFAMFGGLLLLGVVIYAFAQDRTD